MVKAVSGAILKTQLSISITLALALASPFFLTGCSSDSDSPANVQGDGGSNDSPFNTLVKSKVLFNPTVNGDADQATQYLRVFTTLTDQFIVIYKILTPNYIQFIAHQQALLV